MPQPPTAAGPPPTPMSPGEQSLLQNAAELHRPLARAARIGRGNGLGYAIFGGLSLLLAVTGMDFLGMVLGAVLLAVGLGERKWSARLQQADPDAPRQLARLELILLGAIVLYGSLGLTVLPSPGDALQQQLHDTRGLGVDLVRLANSINRAWYIAVIGIALLYQGGMARYFNRRRADLARYLAEAPAWARQVVESMAG